MADPRRTKDSIVSKLKELLHVPSPNASSKDEQNKRLMSPSSIFKRSSSTPGSQANTPRGPSPAPSKSPASPDPPIIQSSEPLPHVTEPATAPDENDIISLSHWVPVNINYEVLKQLRKWNKNHENDSLPSIFKKITTAMESSTFNAALEVIPNSPFPAGSLVKALVGVLALGLKIPERKKDAFDFAMQVVEDLNAMADALGVPTEEPDDVTTQCWSDLKPFGKVTNEICQWAHDQVTSKVAYSNDESVTFEMKLAHANTLFLKLSTIRTMRTISGIGKDVVQLLRYNKRAAKLRSIKAALGSRIAAGYQYKDQGKQKCHEVTRETILKKLDSWIRGPCTEEDLPSSCLWMTGIAGIGKSAIAMSAVQCLRDQRPLSSRGPTGDIPKDDMPILYAQYFCNHLFDTSNMHRLFPTLAVQLAEKSPAAAHIIHTALRKQPTIADEFSREQAESIFLHPFRRLAELSAPTRLVVVIDGVDEFQPADGNTSAWVYSELTSVLEAVAAVLPKNARLLILSRPEHVFLDSIPLHVSVKHCDLTTKESVADVERFFTEELTKLGKRYKLPNFPTSQHLHTLSTSGAGHLGWAKQAFNWLSRRIDYQTSATLDDDIKAIGQIAGGNLDKLYSLIIVHSLPSADDSNRERFMPGLRKLLGCLTVIRGSQPIGVLCGLIKPDSDFDVFRCLARLSSIYASGSEPITSDTVPKPHKSFFDFITTSRGNDFQVNRATAHRELASSCFRIMQDELHFNMGGFNSPCLGNDEAPSKVAAYVVYACSSIAYHVNGSGELFLNNIRRWVTEFFLFWLEVMALSRSFGRLSYKGSCFNDDSEAVDTVKAVLKTFQNNNKGDATLARHLSAAIRFADEFDYIFVCSATAIYTTALPFTPDSSLIARYYHSQQHIRLLSSGKHAESVGHPAISLDGNWVASPTECWLSLFSVVTGSLVWLKLMPSRADRLTFSHDGRTLACATSSPQYVQLFYIPSGEARHQISLPKIDLRDIQVWNIALSYQGDHIAVVVGNLRSSNLYIFRTEDGMLRWQRTIGCHILNVHYLPDGRLANTYGDGRLVDGCTGEELGGFMFDQKKLHDIRHISPSTDGSLLAIVHGAGISWSCGISILMTQPERLITDIQVARVREACFSSDGQLLISCGDDHIVRVWKCSAQTQKWTCITVLYGHGIWTSDLAFLPDGRRVICASPWAKTIRIWDISAVVEGTRFNIEVDEGALAVGGWFSHAIPLGGWHYGEPFVFKHPFKLPDNVKPLDWNIGSEGESSVGEVVSEQVDVPDELEV